jgi:hypothetical protein
MKSEKQYVPKLRSTGVVVRLQMQTADWVGPVVRPFFFTGVTALTGLESL